MVSSKIYSYLLDIQTKCFEFAETHSNESKKYSYQNTALNITNIVITSGVATLTTSFSSLRTDNEGSVVTVSVVSAVLLYVSAVLNSVQQFLNFEKLAEKNKITSIKFITLGNNIKRFLAIEELQNQDIVEYFKWVSSTYEEILSSNTKDELNLELPRNLVSVNIQQAKKDDNNNILNVNLSDTDEEQIMSHQETDRVKYEIDRFAMNSYLYK